MNNNKGKPCDGQPAVNNNPEAIAYAMYFFMRQI